MNTEHKPCRLCKYCEAHVVMGDKGVYLCHRYPPPYKKVRDDKDWCGEWRD